MFGPRKIWQPCSEAGLPDGIHIFKTKILNLGKFWRGLAMEDVGLFYDHLAYFTPI
jgi:hypothetical protein